MTTSLERTHYSVKRDLRTVRKVLRQLKEVTNFELFGQRIAPSAWNEGERRHHERMSICRPIEIEPVRFDGADVTVVGSTGDVLYGTIRDLSLRGVGFMHDELLEADYAVVSFRLSPEFCATLLLEVRWSNVRKDGFYRSGGRFQGWAEA